MIRTKGNLTVIGTSHIAKDSIKQVEKIITEKKPFIIALELDEKRFYAIMNNKRGLPNIRSVGLFGFFLGLILSYIQKKLGQKFNIMPGDEMKKAIYVAKKNHINVALIDDDIEITMRKLSRIGFSEKLRFFMDMFKSFFGIGEKININLSKVPPERFIEKIINMFKKRYPNTYKILISDRNKIMAERLNKLLKMDKKIVAVVGAGHVNGLIKMIKD